MTPHLTHAGPIHSDTVMDSIPQKTAGQTPLTLIRTGREGDKGANNDRGIRPLTGTQRDKGQTQRGGEKWRGDGRPDLHDNNSSYTLCLNRLQYLVTYKHHACYTYKHHACYT